MFTIDQITSAHSKVKNGADFPAYIQDLMKLGVTGYETFVSDGHTDYKGDSHFRISTAAKYETLVIADESNAAQFIANLKAHQQGQTTYPQFCNDCATSGVEKWVVNMSKMTCVYFDKAGEEILSEEIPRG